VKAIAIILAAGESRRMGSPKALLPFAPGLTFAARLAATFAEAGAPALLVVGAQREEILAAHPGLPAVVNARWEAGQLSSVRVGLRAALAQGAQRLLIHPVDAPGIRPSTARKLLAALALHPAVVPGFDGAPGHPLGLTAAGARRVLASRASSLAGAVAPLAPWPVPVRDRAVLDNFNTPEALIC
jgi:molybdenum cofactor cytidylyltransferase